MMQFPFLILLLKGLSVRQTELLAKRDKIEIANKKAVPIKKDLDTQAFGR